MVFHCVTREIYIPEWNGNKDLGPDDQVKCHIKFPTAGERDEYIHRSSKENVWVKTIVSKFCEKIEGLSEVVDGVEKPISTGEDLVRSLSRSLYGLATELSMAILGRAEIDPAEKKS